MKKTLLPGLIVSCQAVEGETFYNSGVMHIFAQAAAEGGAKGIRAGSGDIRRIRAVTGLPIIGLKKICYNNSPVYITPTIKELDEIAAAGADVAAIDATLRVRPCESLEEIVNYSRRKYPDLLLMADIDDIKEALYAESLGFDYISSTLRGYTEQTKYADIPDIEFLKELAKKIKRPVVAEGGIWTTEQMKEVLKTGVYAVVIGTAITRPREITKRFVSIIDESAKI